MHADASEHLINWIIKLSVNFKMLRFQATVINNDEE